MWKSSRHNRTRTVFGGFDFSAPVTSKPIPSPPFEPTTFESTTMRVNSQVNSLSSSAASPMAAGGCCWWVAALVILVVHMWSYLNLGFLGLWVRSLVRGVVSIADHFDRGRVEVQPEEPSKFWLVSEINRLQALHDELVAKFEDLGGGFQELLQSSNRRHDDLLRQLENQRHIITEVKADFLLKMSSVSNTVSRYRREAELLDRSSVQLQDWIEREFEVGTNEILKSVWLFW